MKVSVIIPVYNAERYLAEAVESALAQPETGEVLLIEDGSIDGSLEVCKSLTSAYPKVRLLIHENGANRGPITSRNVGIISAENEYIAFLDNDDYYLPERFKVTKDIFSRNENVDGVYEAVGVFYESEDAAKKWSEIGGQSFIAIQQGIPSDGLFEKVSPIGSAGYCQLNGLTVKRGVFAKTGLFELGVVAEDVTLFMKLAACVNMQQGNLSTPIAMRRIHGGNNYARLKDKNEIWLGRVMMWLSVYKWLKINCSNSSRERLIIGKMLWDAYGIREQGRTFAGHLPIMLCRYFGVIRKEPSLMFRKYFLIGVLRYLSAFRRV